MNRLGIIFMEQARLAEARSGVVDSVGMDMPDADVSTLSCMAVGRLHVSIDVDVSKADSKTTIMFAGVILFLGKIVRKFS